MSTNSTDIRLTAIQNWLKQDLSLEISHIEPASSDASFRRYFRAFHSTGTYVVMDAPPDKENVLAFVDLDRFFENYGLPVPHIYAEHLQAGFLLLEDFGNLNLLEAINDQNASNFYELAMKQLGVLQQISPNAHQLKNSYDYALLNRELDIFFEWFLQGLLKQSMPINIKESLYAHLISSALEQPQTCVHRDFHSRNIMILDDNTLGIIDFQDAVIGPITYDLASLLRDCYINWPEDQVENWVQHYFTQLQNTDKIQTDYAQFKRWFDWMGMQRHLKAIGIFARLHLRDQKSGYLGDIPRTLDYVLAVSAQYPEFAEFIYFLQSHITPIYRDYL